MQRRTRLKRRKRLNPINRERRERLRREQFGPQAELCRMMDCCACGERGPSDPAHVVSRGAGGKDKANVVPLCRPCHIQQGAWGIVTFQRRKGIDMPMIAQALAFLVYGDDATG